MIYQFGVLFLIGTYLSMTSALTSALTSRMTSALPACSCTREVQEMCGNDGKTYTNGCILDCVKQFIKNLQIDYMGPCETEEQRDPPCLCPKIIRSVCASNGVTYDNDCEMRCASASLKVVKEEPCDYD